MDQVFASEDALGEILWALPDNQGTIRDIAEYDSGTGTTTVVNHRKYDSFGNITSQSDSTVDFLYSYTGRIWDADAELFYYRARWYDPAVGQFISEDPSGLAAGDTNLSRYVYNSPANWIDPSGLRGRPIIWPGFGHAPLNPQTDPDAFAALVAGATDQAGSLPWDALDYSANFFAGVGDSLTFRTTNMLREWLGINDGIDHESWTYFSGELVEISVEVGVTLGGAALRHAAARALEEGGEQILRNSRRLARQALDVGADQQVHHIHTLLGHPAIRGGRPAVRSRFPTIGLPRGIHNCRLNLCALDRAAHEALHIRAWRAEQIVYFGAHPILTGTRATLNWFPGLPDASQLVPSDP